MLNRGLPIMKPNSATMLCSISKKAKRLKYEHVANPIRKPLYAQVS